MKLKRDFPSDWNDHETAIDYTRFAEAAQFIDRIKTMVKIWNVGLSVVTKLLKGEDAEVDMAGKNAVRHGLTPNL